MAEMRQVDAPELTNNQMLLRSIEWTAWITAALVFAILLFFFSLELAAYFLLGALLGAVNSLWLKAGLDRLLRASPESARGRGLWLFFVRLFLIMICLYVTIRASFIGALACVGGLSVHILSAMAVGVMLAFKSVGGTPRSPR